MLASYKKQIQLALEKGSLNLEESERTLQQLGEYLDSYPYLLESHEQGSKLS